MGLIVPVLGMHRSGTSFLTQSPDKLPGAYLGPALADDAADDNLEGHFEASEVVQINERILSLSGGSWDQIPAQLYGDAEAKVHMQEFVKELGTHPVSSWKDPRTTDPPSPCGSPT